MNSLPEGWTETSIGAVCEINPKHSSDLDDALQVSFVPMGSIDEIHGRIADHTFRPLGEVKKGYTHFADGDVIFAKITPCMENGNCAVAENLNNGFACGSTEFFVFRPSSALEPKYLYRYLRQEKFRQIAKKALTGVVGQARVPKQFMENTCLPLPPLNEQRRIVAKLDALFEKSRSIREKVDRLPELLDSVRKSILASAFNGDWWEKSVTPNWHPIGLLGKVTGGLTKNSKRTSFPLQVPYLRVANVYANKLLLDDVTLIGATPQEAEKTRLEKGDLLVVEGNGSLDQIGRVAIFDGSIDGCLHQNHLIRVRFPSEILSRWVLFWLLSPAGRGQIVDVASSTTGLHTLSISKVSALRVPVVDEATMQQTLNRLEVALHGVALLEAKCSALKTAVAMTEQATLAKAFRGELVPQNPNDEPASVLLERIRAQKPAVGTKRGRGRKTAGQAEEPVPG